MSSSYSEAWWSRGDWRAWLRRKIGWLLLAKLLGLLLLRSMFFSGEHRHSVDEDGLARRLAVEPSDGQLERRSP
ncbi:MAG TPA: hypothetical protein VIU34_31950 [Steroidobacter sp.]